jgi:hypothetical protein
MQNLENIKLDLTEKVALLNTMILNGQSLEAFEKFYAENVIMQENDDEPTIGKSDNRIREKEFAESITEFRHAEVKNILISDKMSVVEWDYDFTHKLWGKRTFTQLAVQRWNDEGQIVSEKYYYNN